MRDTPIRVVGVGSPHGDDAVAWEAIRRLRAEGEQSPNVQLHAVEGGLRLLDLLDGRGTLLLLDAINAGATPGTIHRFAWPDPRLEDLRAGSTHTLRPAAALALGEQLGLLPPRVVVLGIEVSCLEPSTSLTPAVAAALPELVRRVQQELDHAPSRLPWFHGDRTSIG